MKPESAPSLAESPLLELRGVVKRLGDSVAVGPIDLRVAQGDRLAVVGPSGAGKSTLLKLLLGLEKPDAGTVVLGGAPLEGQDLLAVRRRIGYVVQGGGLFPHLTALRNAGLVARFLGWDAERIATRLAELAGLARLSKDLLDRYPAELSGGQAQRVALIRALVLDPEVLLLDEPLGALDPVTRSELQDDLALAFRRLGKTVVLVTHDLAEAALLCRRIALLREGGVVQEGTLEELVQHPVDPFVSRFVRAQRSALEVLREGR
ncbi:MAG TPA: ATP-binding cassette domain-containing protein [Anaeromyxobacteraceae bacterium]|nr:ATP-binding cassette domain-containing protein [Anaeromyxobacteraceae bacterium]